MYFLILFILVLHSLEAELIVVFGASCAGKSSLSYRLVDALGEPWIHIDLDKVVEREMAKCRCDPDEIEKKGQELLIQEVQQALMNGNSVVVDTHHPETMLDAFDETDKPFLVYVYANLSTLIRRDEERTIRHPRSSERQFRARHFVYTSHATLLTLEPLGDEKPIDSIFGSNFKNDAKRFYFEKPIQRFYKSIYSSQDPLPVYPRMPYDVLIRSDEEILAESAESVKTIIDKRNESCVSYLPSALACTHEHTPTSCCKAALERH